SITLLDARHPLLDPKTVVPINIILDEETRMLMITGPNTGGKTVSLKTVGLLAIMAQAGLRIPAAEGSALPVFNHIFADIGDEQSIEQSLSTFSGHMTNIVRILAQCDEKSLVILDELGAGTDPIEGSALARAILTNLLARGVITFVATHYSDLKAFAHTTPGVANASMEFDLESLAPTYRLLIGLPGASNAFAIAQRLGLPQEIINQARGMVGEDAQQVETMLAQIRSQIEAADQARQVAEQERDEAKAATERLNRRLADIDTERQEILNSARADARREIKAVRQKIHDLQAEAERLSEQQQQQAIAQARATDLDRPDAEPATLEKIEARLATVEADVEARAAPKPAPPPAPTENRRIQPGDQVYIAQYSTVGEVMSVQRGQVEVQLGHFRATVPLGEVELRKKGKSGSPESSRSSVRTPPAESPGLELDLRGQVSEDAVMHLDQYLDQAYMAQLPWVRIIHGKGSGTLRQIVRQALKGHPMVSSYRAGGSGEGGEGVTVAQLAVSD
ncbi:MAG: Smr/MutS family protein, partial [Anaerolineae bacterium]|nr:Smr/MutS family protein [Anaerolineae bacterium]